MSELLPCPFCGGEARSIKTDISHWYQTSTVMCTKCPASISRSGLDAEFLWNTRPALTPNVPTEPGRYRMTMEVDVNLLPGADACFTVWQESEPIGTVGSVNDEKYDITAHFERIKEES